MNSELKQCESCGGDTKLVQATLREISGDDSADDATEVTCVVCKECGWYYTL